MLTDNFDTIPIIGLKVTKRINKSLHIKRESQFEVYMYIDELTKVNEFEKWMKTSPKRDVDTSSSETETGYYMLNICSVNDIMFHLDIVRF